MQILSSMSGILVQVHARNDNTSMYAQNDPIHILPMQQNSMLGYESLEQLANREYKLV